MTGVELLLDTNAVIAWTNRDRGILRLLDRNTVVGISLFTLGELEYGAFKSMRLAANLALIQELLDSVELVLPDRTTANVYGALKNQLRSKARPIPENDLWIAAIASQHGLQLATRDEHFTRVEGLRLAGW